MQENLQKISGVIDSITFRNDNNGYTVLDIVTDDDVITAVGIIPDAAPGEQLTLTGNFTEHPTFGSQFNIKECERSMPVSAGAILRYLSSGTIKGIGPATAKKIVTKFGDKALQIIENEFAKLCEIPGISFNKAKKINECFNEQFGVREAMIFLTAYGVTQNEAIKAYKIYGTRTIEIIKNNPYSLCQNPINISFLRAEEIAKTMGIDDFDLGRIEAAFIFVLKHNLGNGHTCLPKSKLIETVSSLLGIDDIDLLTHNLCKMIQNNVLSSEEYENSEYIFLPFIHYAEKSAANRLQIMLSFCPPPIKNAENYIMSIEQSSGILYDDQQKTAIKDALTKGMLVLTGGPGTGKTTTLKAIIDILESSGEKVAVAAPTGRAAKRISEVTGREAKTIHRLLEAEWTGEETLRFARDEKNPLDCDAIIIDEVSMLDIMLFSSLLNAMKLSCRIILVGDKHQLPAVGAGNVLADLLLSSYVPRVELNTIFRQASKSLIVTNSHKIIAGEMPELDIKDNDFFFINKYTYDSVINTVTSLCSSRLNKTYGYDIFKDIQVLTPGRKGEIGTNSLNKKLQEVLNPPRDYLKEIRVVNTVFREHDKVMQTRNDYCLEWKKDDGTEGLGVFNGDIGILEKIDNTSSICTVRFEDRVAFYSADQMIDLDLCYCSTVHKSQGSEFNAVIVPLLGGAPQLLYRNLLYTAVTRAKFLLIIVGSKEIITKMIANNKKSKRYSFLSYFLNSFEKIKGDI